MRRWGVAVWLALAVGTPGVAAAATPDTGSRLVSRFLAAYDRAKSFKGVIKVVTRRGADRTVMKMDIALEKPNRTAFTILEAAHKPTAVGTRIVWLGAPKAHVDTRFLGFPVRLWLPFDDPRLCDLRGDNLYDLSIVQAVAIVRDPASRFEYLGEDRHNGRAVRKLSMRSPKLLKGIDREVFWLDAASDLPVVREMIEGDEVVYRLTVESAGIDQTLPPETFAVP